MPKPIETLSGADADAFAVAVHAGMRIGLFSALGARKIPVGTSVISTDGFDSAGHGPGRYVCDDGATEELAATHPRACKLSNNGRYFRLLPDKTGAISAEAFRASGDADDTTASLAAGAYAREFGYKFVAYSGRLWTICNAEYGYPGYMMTLPQGVYARDNGATFRAGITPGHGQYGFYYSGVLQGNTTDGVVTSAIAAGDKTIHVAVASAFAAGDYVLFRMGDVDYDPAETYNHGFARIVSVNAGAGTVTLDRAMPRAFTAPEIAAAAVNKGIQKVEPITGQWLGDAIYDDTDTNSLSGMVLLLTQDCRVGTVGGRGLGVAAFVAQYSYGFHVDKIYNYDNPIVGPNTGGIARFAEARGTIGSITSRNCDAQISVEAASILKIGYVEDDNYLATPRTLFQLGGRSHVDVDRVMLLGLGGQNLFDPQDNSQFSVKHVHVRTATMPAGLGKFGKHITESLTLELAGAAPEVYRAADGYWVEKVINLRNSMADSVQIAPPGCLIAESWIYVSGGVTAGLNYLNIGRNGGANVPMTGEVTPGSWRSSPYGWHLADTFNVQRNMGVSVYVDTAAAGGGVPNLNGELIVVRLLVIPESSFATTADSKANVLSQVSPVLRGVASLAVPALAAGAESGWLWITPTPIAVKQGVGHLEVQCQGMAYDLAIVGARVHPSGDNIALVNVKNLGGSAFAGATYDFSIEYRL